MKRRFCPLTVDNAFYPQFFFWKHLMFHFFAAHSLSSHFFPFFDAFFLFEQEKNSSSFRSFPAVAHPPKVALIFAEIPRFGCKARKWKIFFKRLSSSVCSFIALSLLKSYLSSPASVNLTVNFRCQITLFDFAQINDCILEQKFIVIFQCSQRPRHCLFSLPSPIRIHSKKILDILYGIQYFIITFT